jgi:hypothetical protein
VENEPATIIVGNEATNYILAVGKPIDNNYGQQDDGNDQDNPIHLV